MVLVQLLSKHRSGRKLASSPLGFHGHQKDRPQKQARRTLIDNLMRLTVAVEPMSTIHAAQRPFHQNVMTAKSFDLKPSLPRHVSMGFSDVPGMVLQTGLKD